MKHCMFQLRHTVSKFPWYRLQYLANTSLRDLCCSHPPHSVTRVLTTKGLLGVPAAPRWRAGPSGDLDYSFRVFSTLIAGITPDCKLGLMRDLEAALVGESFWLPAGAVPQWCVRKGRAATPRVLLSFVRFLNARTRISS